MYIDLLTQIKNAEMVGKKSVKVKFSKIDRVVAEILEKAGFLKRAEVKGRAFKKIIDLEFNYARPLRGFKFLSRPSLRRYSGYSAFKKAKGGLGLVIVSTSRGLMTSTEAKKQKVGGQLLFEIW